MHLVLFKINVFLLNEGLSTSKRVTTMSVSSWVKETVNRIVVIFAVLYFLVALNIEIGKLVKTVVVLIGAVIYVLIQVMNIRLNICVIIVCN